MTSVVVADITQTVVVTEGDGIAVVSASSPAVVVELGNAGPQGAQGPGFVVDTAATVDKSVVYYDATSSAFRADAIWTTTTLSDGGNF